MGRDGCGGRQGALRDGPFDASALGGEHHKRGAVEREERRTGRPQMALKTDTDVFEQRVFLFRVLTQMEDVHDLLDGCVESAGRRFCTGPGGYKQLERVQTRVRHVLPGDVGRRPRRGHEGRHQVATGANDRRKAGHSRQSGKDARRLGAPASAARLFGEQQAGADGAERIACNPCRRNRRRHVALDGLEIAKRQADERCDRARSGKGCRAAEVAQPDGDATAHRCKANRQGFSDPDIDIGQKGPIGVGITTAPEQTSCERERRRRGAIRVAAGRRCPQRGMQGRLRLVEAGEIGPPHAGGNGHVDERRLKIRSTVVLARAVQRGLCVSELSSLQQ